MKLTAILLTAIFAISGCGGGSHMTQERQITPTFSPQVRTPAPISNVTAFMGDSITQRWDLTQFDTGPTINFGIGGNLTSQMLARFDAVIAAAPGVVVILGGINDLAAFGPSANTNSIKAMADMAKAAGIRVILCSVLPQDLPPDSGPPHFTLTDIQAFNSSLLDLAKENGYLYADYYDVWLNPDGSPNDTLYVDGTHPNATGYAKMWAVLAPLITEDLN